MLYHFIYLYIHFFLLLLQAQPEKTGSKPGEPSNLAQLSGGERSYVTIAFLLSLWDRIHMPFRILDEYDVFMVCIISCFKKIYYYYYNNFNNTVKP